MKDPVAAATPRVVKGASSVKALRGHLRSPGRRLAGLQGMAAGMGLVDMCWETMPGRPCRGLSAGLENPNPFILPEAQSFLLRIVLPFLYTASKHSPTAVRAPDISVPSYKMD